jgi:putative ABC transport system permease protein
MIRNYFIVAIRHLARHKLFSSINVLCMAIGISFAMLIGAYIIREKNVDAGLKNAGNQYVLKSKWKVKDMGLPITTVAALPKALKEEYPTLVANYYRFNPVTNVVSAGDKHFKENVSICDTSFVSMYGFQLLHGDPQHAFKDNSSAVITEELAIKLFGTTEVINKTVTLSGTALTQQDFIVSAVLKSMPYTTVNNIIDKDGYSMYVPLKGNQYFGGPDQSDSWANIYYLGMIELKPGVSPKDIVIPAAHLLSLNLPANLKGLLEPELVPLKDYYLRDNNNAVQKIITTLTLVALFILVMAVINFVNISIGTSSYRLREIGLRKVFGSARRQLIVQYLAESLVLTCIAALVSLALYELARPVFDQLLNTKLDPIWQFGWYKTGLLLLLVVGVGLIAGIYPAFILSASNILDSVRGKIDSAKGGLGLRKALLVVQFTLAIVIFISALNVSKQVSYFFNKDLGYSKDQLMVLTAFPKRWDSVGIQKMEMAKNGLRELPVVRAATLSFEVPDRTPPNTLDLLPVGSGKPVVMPTNEADEDYEKAYGFHLKEGSFFKNHHTAARRSEIVLNETAAKALGLEPATGKTVRMPSGFAFTVAGVVKDFNYSSFQQSIGPIAFMHVRNSNRYRYLTLKLHASDMAAAVEQVRDKWNSLLPGSPFEFTFMDDRFQSMYKSELQLKQATRVATVLNLFIVFLGIFGIVGFTLARRTKEIAVRKVLGAEVKNIILLFIKDYAWLILLANIIAWPLAYVVTDQWLQSYVYRVQQDIIPYLSVAVFIFLAAFMFITAQCFKVAVSNPVKNLRNE